MRESEEYAQAYFDGQRESNEEFWSRFGTRPEVSGKRILEVGCGHGAMSVELARRGALVTGVDLDHDRIDFARRNVAKRFPELLSRVSFRAEDVATLSADEPFDFIVSKDTFEHVEDVASLLKVLGSLLAPEGVAFIGFSPLYFSPFGDHGRTGMRLPWAHAFLPRRVVLAAAARHNRATVGSLLDIGLNGFTPKDFRDAFTESGLKLIDLRYNQGDKRLLKGLTKVRARVPFLERFATVSIYAQFTNAKASIPQAAE